MGSLVSGAIISFSFSSTAGAGGSSVFSSIVSFSSSLICSSADGSSSDSITRVFRPRPRPLPLPRALGAVCKKKYDYCLYILAFQQNVVTRCLPLAVLPRPLPRLVVVPSSFSMSISLDLSLKFTVSLPG